MSDTGIYLTRGAEGLNRRGFTISEIEKMVEAGILDPEEKFELVDGEIVPMSPQLMPHARMRTRIANWLTSAAPAGVEVIVEATLQINERQFFETDVLAFRSKDVSRYVPPGAVHLAVEVAHSSRAYDLFTKAPRYGMARVPELWVVELNERRTYVFRDPGTPSWDQPAKVDFTDVLIPLFLSSPGLRISDLDV